MATDISVIITAHKEGELLYPTVRSANEAIRKLKSNHDLNLSVLIYLDDADDYTKSAAKDVAELYGFDILEGSNGDPGQARMDAIQHVTGEYIALLDGDDLWSDNWLQLCWQYILDNSPEGKYGDILHPEYNLIFGAHNLLVRQGDPGSPFYDEEFLRLTNYWDALCFARRQLFLDISYQKNDVSSGFAHEDYLWMCETLSSGVSHVLMKDAVHFKRRRMGSVSQFAEERKVKVRFNNLSLYGDSN